MATVGTNNTGSDKVFSRNYLRSISKYEVVKIYRSIFNESPHCHSDEPALWESVYDAILSGIPQKIDPAWD